MTQWNESWPTEPGWYWVRDGKHSPEPARVSIGGRGHSEHIVWVVNGAFAYPGEKYWESLRWGPRIQEPND